MATAHRAFLPMLPMSVWFDLTNSPIAHQEFKSRAKVFGKETGS